MAVATVLPDPNEESGAAALNLTPDAERRAAEAFARHYSAPEYRERFNRLYPLWRYYNATYFENRLEVPHINIGLVSPRRFSDCRRTTDNGGEINIVLAERIVFGTARRVIRLTDLVPRKACNGSSPTWS